MDLHKLACFFITAIVAVISSGCFGGSLTRDVRTDMGSAHQDVLSTSVDTRGSTSRCLGFIETSRDSMLEDYCRMTGGCSGEGATEETTTTVSLDMAIYCPRVPDSAICRELSNIEGPLPTLESVTVTRRTEPATRTTGIDSGFAFFASSSMAAQNVRACQQLASMGVDITANPLLGQALAMGMPLGQAMSMLGIGTAGGFGGGAAMRNITLDATGMRYGMVAMVTITGTPVSGTGAVASMPVSTQVSSLQGAVTVAVADGMDYQVTVQCLLNGSMFASGSERECFSNRYCAGGRVELDVICGRN